MIRAINGTVPAGRAELRVSTAHKAKGLEWERVRIATDYRQPLDKQTGRPLPIPREDAMLAYVAVTRAKSVFDNAGLAWVHSHQQALGALTGEGVDQAPARPLPDPLPGQPGTGVEETSERVGRATRQQHLSVGSLTTPTSNGDGQAVGRGLAVAQTVEEYLAPYELAVGCSILVAEEHGTFVIRGLSKDGSVIAYRPDGDGGARNFRPEWCVPAVRPGKGGKLVKVRTVPAGARAARAAWKARYSVSSLDMLPVGQLGVQSLCR